MYIAVFWDDRSLVFSWIYRQFKKFKFIILHKKHFTQCNIVLQQTFEPHKYKDFGTLVSATILDEFTPGFETTRVQTPDLLVHPRFLLVPCQPLS